MIKFKEYNRKYDKLNDLDKIKFTQALCFRMGGVGHFHLLALISFLFVVLFSYIIGWINKGDLKIFSYILIGFSFLCIVGSIFLDIKDNKDIEKEFKKRKIK